MPTLKEWRAQRLLTVRGLAEAAGVAATTVYLVETGQSAPTFRVIRTLSDALGVQPEEVTEFAAVIAAVGQGKAGGQGRRRNEATSRGDIEGEPGGFPT